MENLSLRRVASDLNLVSLSKNSSIDERMSKMKMWLSMLESDSSVIVYQKEASTTAPSPIALSDIIFAPSGNKTGEIIGSAIEICFEVIADCWSTEIRSPDPNPQKHTSSVSSMYKGPSLQSGFRECPVACHL
jgi:hypothetical protein